MAIAAVALASGWPFAAALAGPVGRGFVISPAFQEVGVAAGQPQAQFQIKLTNRTGQDQNFRLSTTDFGSLDEEGGVAFLGQPTSELQHRYGLASWMTLGSNAVFVPAGASASLTVYIDNRASLAPGGHYGAVLATAVTEGGQPSGDHVGVQQVLSSLVLADKTGGEVHDLRLVSQTANGQTWRLPGQSEQRFQNAGNVHVIPRGIVEVKDPLGRVVGRGAMNAESGMILPESFRRYQTPLLSIAPAWLPGRYSITSTYRYDGSDQTKTFTTYVWYAGLLIVWIMAVLVAMAIGGLAWWLWWRGGRRPRRG